MYNTRTVEELDSKVIVRFARNDQYVLEFRNTF